MSRFNIWKRLNLSFGLKLFAVAFWVLVVLFLYFSFRTPTYIEGRRHSIALTESQKWISANRKLLEDIAPQCLLYKNPIVTIDDRDSLLVTEMIDSVSGCSISTDGMKIIGFRIGRPRNASHGLRRYSLNSDDRARVAIISRLIDTSKYWLEFISEHQETRWYCFHNPSKGFTIFRPFSFERDPYTNFAFEGDSIVMMWRGF